MQSGGDRPTLPDENVYGHTKKLHFILETIADLQKRLGRPPRVLDFGCGNGEAVSRFIIAAQCEYCGVDFHHLSLDYARRNFGSDTARFSTEIPPDTTFDLLVYADFLEHVPNPADVLAAHSRLLAPGGRVVGSVPNGYGPYEIEQRIDRWLRLSRMIGAALRWRRKLFLLPTAQPGDPPYNHESGHVYFFTRKSLAACAAAAGLRITKWQNGAMLGANLSGLVIGRSRHLREWNVAVADFVPAWAVSTWYFVLERVDAASAGPAS
jgi:SAM-dependent methyltransferase